VRTPGVDAEPALAAYGGKVRAIENLEHEPETFLELTFPLLEHRGRSAHHDGLHFPAQEELASDEAGLDRLAQAGVVSDEQVHTRKAERLAKRLHLIGVDLDAGAKRRLKEVRVGCRDRVPAQRVEEGRELPRVVEPLRCDVVPSLFLKDEAVGLVVPVDLQCLALIVVVCACQSHKRRLARRGSRADVVDEPAPRADEY